MTLQPNLVTKSHNTLLSMLSFTKKLY